MRRIKSAPANIAAMINRKKPNEHLKDENQNKNCKKLIINYELYNYFNLSNEKFSYTYKKELISNKKKVTILISNIISDSFIETNKYIKITDNFTLSYIIEVINNFITNKFNRKNLENLGFSLLIRFIFSQMYHDLIIKIKENIHLIQ